jgi:hypothetical protein
MEFCEICKRPNRSKKDRFCHSHSRLMLKKMESSGYLEPLRVTTQDGVQNLSNRRFLTLPEDPMTTN